MSYDVIIIGAGHAGAEAALACARTGQRTLCLALNTDSIAYLACNPAIGGTSKGHLVREVDALGGQMGLTADQTLLQMRLLNLRKGPAVHSSRAQVDKQAYANGLRKTLETQENLTIFQTEATELLLQGNKVTGVRDGYGRDYHAPCVVVCSGVYLNSRVIVGEHTAPTGPNGLMRATHLGPQLASLGLPLRRFKTGTPPRIDRNTIDFSKLILQQGDDPPLPFSFLTDPEKFARIEQLPCHLGYTNERTHALLRDNLSRSPLYSGVIEGTGARYCPSIEDKVVRFADKERHQLFIEPEGRHTTQMYVQGFSTSMPFNVQQEALQTVSGLERAHIVRPGYAIEYDCLDGRCLSLSLMHKDLEGLFFAGQIVGSSGYEEAAAQGLLAGLNASLYLRGRDPLLLTRMQAYAGVLVDDLVTKGTPEPYRMMTARAEYRLLLRQDNADLRLTELGHQAGLVTDQRLELMAARKDAIHRCLGHLSATRLTKAAAPTTDPALYGQSLAALLTRPEFEENALCALDDSFAAFPRDVREQAAITLKYQGYIQRQQREVARAQQLEEAPLPPTLDYEALRGLRIEARQKLAAARPQNLGQASRISGVSPSDIAVLTIYLKKQQREASHD